MNRKKLATLIAICFTVSTGIVPVNATPITQPVNLQDQIPQKNNLPSDNGEDKTLPTLPLVNIISSSNSSTAKVGDTITLKFTSSESLSKKPTVTILGNTLDVNSIGNNEFTATYKLDHKDQEGLITFNISDVVDLASNSMETNVSKLSSGDSINFINPILSEVTLSSNNKNKDYAKPGDIITLNFSSFCPLTKVPVVKIDGVSAITTALTPTTYNATYTLTDANSKGDVSFVIEQLSIIVDVVSLQKETSITYGSGVTFFKSIPTVSNVGIDSSGSKQSAKNGSTIHLNFTTDMPLDLRNPSTLISIFGETVKPQLSSSANSTYTYTSDYILKDSDPENIIFNISNLADFAGNINPSTIKSVTDDKTIKHDKISPAISNVTFKSNNTLSDLAKPDNEVTLEFDTDGTESKTTTVNIDGHSVLAVKDPNSNHYKAKYILDNTTKDGQIKYDFDGIMDEAGNIGIPSVPGKDIVTFDKTVPTFSDINLKLSNGNSLLSNYANVSDTVKLTFTSSEKLKDNQFIKINGHDCNVILISGDIYSASYKLAENDDDAPINFNISSLLDYAGNKSIDYTSTTDDSSIIFDRTAPLITFSGVANNGYTNISSPKIKITDSYLDTSKTHFELKRDGITLDNITPITNPDGSYSFQALAEGSYNLTITAEDYASNITSPQNLSFTIDRSSPEIEIMGVTDKEYTNNESITPIVKITDDSLASGYPTFKLTKDGKQIKTNANFNIINNTFSFPTSEGGEYELTIIAKDEAGTAESIKSISYTIDRTAPNITFSGIANNSYTNISTPKIEITDSYLDDSKTHFKLTRDGIQINNITPSANPDGLYSYPALAAGTYNLTVTAEDYASNITTPQNLSFTIDRSSPEIEIMGVTNKEYTNNHTITPIVKITDDSLASGYPIFKLTKNGKQIQANANFNIINNTFSFPTSDNGDYELTIIAKDEAGNPESVKSISYTIDQTAPTISISGVLDNEFNNNASTSGIVTFYDKNLDPSSSRITINGSDVSSGIKRNANGSYSYNFSKTEEGKYIIKTSTYDLAKNVTTKDLTFNIDRTLPVLVFNENAPYVNTIFKPQITKGSPEDTIFEVLINGVSVNPNNLPVLTKNQKYVIEAISIDEAGNISKPTTSTFILDTIRPKINVSGLIQSFFYATDVDPNITFSDANLLSSSMTLNGVSYSNGKITKDGVYDLKLSSSDKAENSNEQLIHFVIDKSSPSIEFRTPLNNKTFNTMIKPYLITHSKYGLDSISMTLDGEVYHGEDITIEGKHTIIVTAKNKSGKETKKSFTFFIKTTPPIIRITNVQEGKSYKAGIIPEIYQEEAVKYQMTLNGKPYIYGLAINDAGHYTLVIKATDTADNVATKTIHFTIENKTLVSAIKSIKAPKLTSNPRSILPFIGTLLVLCLGGVIIFIKSKSRKNKRLKKEEETTE